MTGHRRTRWLPPPPRAAGTVLCMLALGACSEGYPTEDVPQMEPAKMTLLETRRWPDAVRARSLLTQLELRCGQPAAQPA